ncbi:RNase P/RNase MRP complex subunit [Coemansia sp. RSA 2711]|nr:RNase P/RNase MRP complex subunit [Coemansia sp. RSA 2711]KAJ1846924.1 RNase P/RNase MRP complex subunit [Coemansia sp. RSA 2708]KAJ2318604.1 RNase P/RNase MRP complex subunit [Coemansia sp. RSA 2704]KAJ2378446.1 RNase P/RNase MRP complex subunit [Coemansia sp. RSA 2611]KAJ2719707.1 RNase P/RNase MRP complex subunit [Coemansia sp. Cherry 401B]
MADKPQTFDIYAQLAKNVKSRSGAPADIPMDSTTGKFTPGLIERTINTDLSDAKAQTVFTERVESRMLLLTNPYKDNMSKPGRVGSNMEIARRSQRKRITAKEKRRLKIYELPAEARRYALFLPLHRLWTKYISTLLGDKDVAEQMADLKQQQQLLGRLLKADLHGAKLEVERSKCPNFVGLAGIVAQETKNAFKLITQDDRLVVVPKARCVFTLHLPSDAQCLIYGDQFMYRASERASKKFKPRPSVDL